MEQTLTSHHPVASQTRRDAPQVLPNPKDSSALLLRSVGQRVTTTAGSRKSITEPGTFGGLEPGAASSRVLSS